MTFTCEHFVLIAIFSRGKIKKQCKFLFGGNELEIVDKYAYLGSAFNYNGSFNKAINKEVS